MTRLCLLLLFSAFPALAQDPSVNPIGTVIAPNAGIILFDAPPNSAFQAQPVAQAILQPGPLGNTLFTLQPDTTALSGYSATGQTIPTTSHLVVSNFVDVYQDKALNRWVEVSPVDKTAPPAWVLWGEAGQSPQGFTIITSGGN